MTLTGNHVRMMAETINEVTGEWVFDSSPCSDYQEKWMKKNKQMKPDNVAKRLWAFFIVLTMCITVQPVVPVKAQEAVQTAARTIYTEFKDGNSTHSGDGSYGNPYNLFEDAYAAAGNGDEISILGSGAFLNAEAAEPFIFDKSVTVNGNGNTFSSISPDNQNRGMSQKPIPLSLH